MQRERPLQTSMILPDSNYSGNRRPSGPVQYSFPLQNIKKVQAFTPTEAHYQHPSHLIQNNRQFQTQNSYDEQPGNLRNGDGLADIYERLDKLGRAVDKHEFQLSSISIESELSKRVLNEVKKNLPMFTGNNDTYQNIMNLKMELKNLHEEVAKTAKFADLDQIMKKIGQGTLKNNQNSGVSISNPKLAQIEQIFHELCRKRDQSFQSILDNLSTELAIVKKTLATHNTQMKVSPITSGSTIMLKYQQIIKARNKSENDIILNQHTYYIDNEGHLLDCHSRYLVDQKGKKIKLEDRHLGLLKNQKILQ